ncbi:hypothetical protein JB92DRAFT_3100013 [Gautieria morchelliformis]|nr:hypothetical protein JB92DRAFT_3100013 [Gautieria morchelliformis]
MPKQWWKCSVIGIRPARIRNSKYLALRKVTQYYMPDQPDPEAQTQCRRQDELPHIPSYLLLVDAIRVYMVATNSIDPEAVIRFAQIRSIRELQTRTLFAVNPEVEVSRNRSIFHTRVSGPAPLLVWAEKWDPIFKTGIYYPSTLKLRAWKIVTTELTEPAEVVRLGFPNDHIERIVFSITRHHEKWHFIWVVRTSSEEPLHPVSVRAVCEKIEEFYGTLT